VIIRTEAYTTPSPPRDSVILARATTAGYVTLPPHQSDRHARLSPFDPRDRAPGVVQHQRRPHPLVAARHLADTAVPAPHRHAVDTCHLRRARSVRCCR
jgi:hypothetical protein